MAKTHKIIQSLNSGELSPMLDARIDQSKYMTGCRVMENAYPLIYGGSERRPGTKYIVSQKDEAAIARVEGFEFSVDDTYVLQMENQCIRVLKDGRQVLEGVGTDDISALDNQVAHWKLDEASGISVEDSVGVIPYTGMTTEDISTFSAEGKVGTGCFDLDGQYTVEVADAAGLSFTDNTDDSPFSAVLWAYIDKGGEQVLLSKWRDNNVNREYKFGVDSTGRLRLILADTSSSLSGNLVAQWYLNDTAGNTHCDEVTTNHDGVIANGEFASTLTDTGLPAMTPCFNFDGQYGVEVADSPSLSFDDSGSNPFSVAAWVYVTTTGADQHILTKWNDGNREWELKLTGTKTVSFRTYDDTNNVGCRVTTDDVLTDGWHFVVATYDSSGGSTAGNGMTIYVDSSIPASTTFNNASYVKMRAGSANVAIGGNYSASTLITTFGDKIDNVMLFDIELSQSNISSLYNSGNGTESLVGAEISATSEDIVDIGWQLLGFTYAAADNGSATAADGITLYVDGDAVSSTKENNANYTAMQNGVEGFRIGSQRNSGDSANEKFWKNKVDEVSLYSDVLTPAEMSSLYSEDVYEIASPYLTEDLRTLDIKQSADVMFISHPCYEPRRLSRLADNIWTMKEIDIGDGPFRSENSDVTKTITASGTTGSVTLTAVGHSPFVPGATSGHQPSGSLPTSKSKTGTLFRLVQGLSAEDQYVSGLLAVGVADVSTDTLSVTKGTTWDLVTNGTWGSAANPATVVLERSYDSGTTYETVVSFTSAANYNIVTDDTEDSDDAIYRLTVKEAGGASNMAFNLSVRGSNAIGIVEITSVTSPTVAMGTVRKNLSSTDPTHKWSEGEWSNYRGWPRVVDISPEERLTFSGSAARPLTSWGSVSGDFESFEIGTNDDDATIFTLVGSGQQNAIQWQVPRASMMIGTVGGEHLLGGSSAEEALTPSNVTAKIKGTRGSERLPGMLVNDSILFVQRGGQKVRELSNIDTFDISSYRADDLTVFSNHILESGVVDWAYQRTPDPMLWCVRDDGQLAVMMYERQQEVFSWSRVVLAGTDAKAESVTVIYGGASNEDEVWITVSRTVDGATVRNVEQVQPRVWGSSDSDMFFVDSGITDTSGSTTISSLDHLEGEALQVLGDGLVQSEGTPGDFTVSGGEITVPSGLTKVQCGLGYETTIEPMKIDIQGLGLTVKKKITDGTLSLYKTIGGKWGDETGNLYDFDYTPAETTSTTLFTGNITVPFDGGYEREGNVIVKQTLPLPMTVLSLMLDLGVHG